MRIYLPPFRSFQRSRFLPLAQRFFSAVFISLSNFSLQQGVWVGPSSRICHAIAVFLPASALFFRDRTVAPWLVHFVGVDSVEKHGNFLRALQRVSLPVSSARRLRPCHSFRRFKFSIAKSSCFIYFIRKLHSANTGNRLRADSMSGDDARALVPPRRQRCAGDRKIPNCASIRPCKRPHSRRSTVAPSARDTRPHLPFALSGILTH